MRCEQIARTSGMRVLAAAAVLGALVCAASLFGKPRSVFAQITQRSVQGRVVDSNDKPISGAIVYVSDVRTMTVESYITQEDGAYSFEDLSPNDNYKLWAKFDGRKSTTRTLSSFDDRPVFRFILHIDTAKKTK